MLHNDLDGGQWAPTCVFLAAKCVQSFLFSVCFMLCFLVLLYNLHLYY